MKCTRKKQLPLSAILHRDRLLHRQTEGATAAAAARAAPGRVSYVALGRSHGVRKPFPIRSRFRPNAAYLRATLACTVRET